MVAAMKAKELPEVCDDRQHTRMKVAWKVKAITEPGGLRYTCVVQDVSVGGARLKVLEEVQLPDRFLLYLPLRDQVEDVVVRWRNTDRSEIGVAFVQAEAAASSNLDLSGIDQIAQIQDQIAHLEDHLQKVGSELFRLKLSVAMAARCISRSAANAVVKPTGRLP
jgi:hypothetical protein